MRIVFEQHKRSYYIKVADAWKHSLPLHKTPSIKQIILSAQYHLRYPRLIKNQVASFIEVKKVED